MQNWIFDIRSRLFVLLSFGFLILTTFVYFGFFDQFDQASITYFQNFFGNDILDGFMLLVTEIGTIYYMLGFSIVLLIIRRTRRIGAVLLILMVSTTIVTGYIKCGVDRDRPSEEFAENPFQMTPSRDTFSLFCGSGADASFPSGHAARAMALAVVLGYIASKYFPRGSYLILIYPILMSISRVYISQHYPTDVIGGMIIGMLLAGVISYKAKL
ncbi:MAG: phosphatase PAP2 family protein [Candidatus Nitrosoabyssus spongiisocia]|nr:MAG: phosphatase PAP2 family protein [Nitrosopumilaceae archaeon AB1(1)]